MEQIPLPKHVTDRVEKRWAASRFCKKDCSDADINETRLARLRARRNGAHRHRRLSKTRRSDFPH
ncbi:MAG TPA: hypothetical protein VHB49_19495 [Bradyrhizobium sp.]|nr:hypothetical protein [Bradyrhizobium sp.]